MSEEGSHGNLWETHTRALSNSDNSGGSDDKLGKKPSDSSSNSPTATTEVTLVGQKQGRKGVLPDNGKASGDGGGESEHEIHIWTERERRKKMRNMFSGLHALLPQLPAKADKSTVVDEAVKYIKTLQHTLQTLQKQKLEMLQSGTIIDYEPSIITSQAPGFERREAFLADQGSSKNFSMATNLPHSLPVAACFQTWFSPNVVMSMCGDDAQISVCSLRRPGLLANIFYILEKHKLDVVSAHISSDHHRSMYMIHAHAGGGSDQFPEALPVEEVFKLAVGEMNFCLSSC